MRSPPEDDEFRRATRDVEPLPAPRRVRLSRQPAAPVPEQTRRDERAALSESLSGSRSIGHTAMAGTE